MLKVGQKLWLVPSHKYYGPAREVEIEKVGRKFANITGRKRIFIGSLVVDDESGKCHLSREAFEADQLRQSAWSKFRTDLSYYKYRLHDATIEEIQKARAILRMPEE